MKASLSNLWRISTFKLAVWFGVYFCVVVFVLFGLIYWQVSGFMTQRVDSIIHGLYLKFESTDSNTMAARLRSYVANDVHKIKLFGLFTPQLTRIDGDFATLPRELPVDGEIHQFYFCAGGSVRAVTDGGHCALVRATAIKMPQGEILVLGRDVTQLMEIRLILFKAFLLSAVAFVIFGLGGGMLLSLHPLRRINRIREQSRKIAQGNLALRMPVSKRHDEIDMLTSTVNRLLGDMEILLTEVKSSTDALAHDLRTPLTRLRLLLYRGQQQSTPGSNEYTIFENSLLETDQVLRRFCALLRISEIESRQRQSGFKMFKPEQLIKEVHEIFSALAEERSINLDLSLIPTREIFADPELLFEVMSNVVENAIKFTPEGGNVCIRLIEDRGWPCIEVIDSGCGIDAGERGMVMKKFYRTQSVRESDVVSGYGLGLSTVAAILRLHGYALEFRDVEQGTYLRIVCSGTPAIVNQVVD